MKIASIFAITLAGALSTPASAGPTNIETRVQDLLASFHDEYGFPGATVAYVLQDGTRGDAFVGLADVEADNPMTPQSRMLAASIGKTFVGALVVSLENQGVLDRSQRVSVYLGDTPWFSRLPNAADITIEHLLTHTSGLPDHVHMDGFAAKLAARDMDTPITPQDAIAFVLDDEPLFEAGSAWAYSDTGYLLLGLVIEDATGRDFYDLVRERFLTPLDLGDTSPSDTPDIAGLAVGYTVSANPFGLPPRTMNESGVLSWDPAVEWTGGGFASTSRDLADWGHALFSGDALETRYLEQLLDGQAVHPDAPGVFYASGVAIYSQTPRGAVYGHGGWVPGYVSSLRHYADADVTIAFQINTDVGVVDDSTDLVPAFEAALATLLIDRFNSN